MVGVDGGGVGKYFSEGVSRGGLLGGVGRRLGEPEGETGGEHLVLHAGQFLFDDNHWRVGKPRDIEVRSGQCTYIHQMVKAETLSTAKDFSWIGRGFETMPRLAM